MNAFRRILASVLSALCLSFYLTGCANNRTVEENYSRKTDNSEKIENLKSEENNSDSNENESENEVVSDFEEVSEESKELQNSNEENFMLKIPDPLEVGFEELRNPFSKYAADPYVMKYEDKYYYCYASDDKIYVSKFDSLKKITRKNAVCVFSPPAFPTSYGSEIWAPELHNINGEWYIYFAGDDGDNYNHRMFVLKSSDRTPMGQYELLGMITDSTNKWAIDGSVFEYKDALYYVWSGWQGDENIAQNIYIAKMDSPTSLSSERVCISMPEKRWEIQGGSPAVNEGPCAIVDGDYLSILYSASGSWCDDYCVGQLIFEGGDILNPDNWKKHYKLILKKDENRFYGPGHCSVVPDENGVLWIVFHANSESGTGWEGRSGWMYPIRIKENGVVEVIFY